MIETIKYFWNETGGGYGGGPMQLGHTATTYASCLSLAVIGTPEALDLVDRQALYRFFMERKHATTGGFSAHDGGYVLLELPLWSTSLMGFAATGRLFQRGGCAHDVLRYLHRQSVWHPHG